LKTPYPEWKRCLHEVVANARFETTRLIKTKNNFIMGPHF